MTPRRALVLARVATGTLVLVRTTPLGRVLPRSFAPGEWVGATDAHGWTATLLGPAFPWAIVVTLVAARTVFAALFAMGVRPRWTGVICAVSGYALLLQDRFAFVNALHVLYLGTAALALASPPRSDEADADAERGVLFVARFLATIYFWAGLSKVSAEWLSGRALALEVDTGAFLGPLGRWIAHGAVRSVVAPAVVALELLVAVLLVLDRRKPAVILALAFHLGVELTVVPSSLGWQMALFLWLLWPRPGVGRPSAAC